MAKKTIKKGTKLLVADKKMLGIAGKALGLTLDGEKLPDKLKGFLKPGDFGMDITVHLRVEGTVGVDSSTTRYFGVEIDHLVDTALAMMGFTEDHVRKSAEVAAELRRAELEERPLRSVSWVDSKDEVQQVGLDELQKVKERIEERKKRFAEEANRLSQLVKKEVPYRAPVKIEALSCAVKEGIPTTAKLVKLK